MIWLSKTSLCPSTQLLNIEPNVVGLKRCVPKAPKNHDEWLERGSYSINIPRAVVARPAPTSSRPKPRPDSKLGFPRLRKRDKAYLPPKISKAEHSSGSTREK